ncbi:MAG TPA: hypothetical protein VK633_07660, partial [Verrucomicrobiae bacterium]|nr:hypothetical protein [Verrucomicrobiae bacterium]
MSIWPVIVRELRSEARNTANYTLRVAGGGGILGAVGIAMLIAEDPAKILFSYINLTILIGLCLLVPALAADCISRERREGTLGLLFLTPLSSVGIVAGKGFVHGLRALTLLLSMLPVMAVPLLAGGVSFQDFIMALLIDSGVLVLSLAAGIFASAFSRVRLKAIALAEFLSVIFLLTYLSCHVGLWLTMMPAPAIAGQSILDSIQIWFDVTGWDDGFSSAVRNLLSFGANFEGTFRTDLWALIWTSTPISVQHRWLWSAGGAGAATILVLMVTLLLASWRVRCSWQDLPPTVRGRRISDFFCRPRFRTEAFRQSLRRNLDRNPIGWLHFYSWKARMIKWGWLMAVIVLQSAIGMNWDDRHFGQSLIVGVVVSGMALSASSSFRKDRDNGTLELLVITPLRTTQIIVGRVLAIYAQFAPTFAALIIMWRALDVSLVLAIPALTTSLTLPIVGLFFSLYRMNL